MQTEQPIDGRRKFATSMAWIVFALALASAVFELLEAQGTISLEEMELAPLAALAAIVYLLLAGAYVVSIVAVAMWIHRSHAKISASGMEGLEFTPGWAVGWYFIPFANLVKPFQAMKELWNAVMHGDEHLNESAPSLLAIWWTTWLVGNFASNISARLVLSETGSTVTAGLYLGVAGSIVTAACAFVLVQIIRQVSHALEAGHINSNVFT